MAWSTSPTFVLPCVGLGSNGGGTTTYDTTGVKFLVIAVAYASIGTQVLTDSYSNVYTPLTPYELAAPYYTSIQMYWCSNPIVGAAHSWQVTGINIYAAVGGVGGTGPGPSPFFGENGDAAHTALISTGTVAPSIDASLFVTACCVSENFTDPTALPPFTPLDSFVQSTFGFAVGMGIKWYIKPLADSQNASWLMSDANVAGLAATVAVFSPVVDNNNYMYYAMMMGNR